MSSIFITGGNPIWRKRWKDDLMQERARDAASPWGRVQKHTRDQRDMFDDFFSQFTPPGEPRLEGILDDHFLPFLGDSRGRESDIFSAFFGGHDRLLGELDRGPGLSPIQERGDFDRFASMFEGRIDDVMNADLGPIDRGRSFDRFGTLLEDRLSREADPSRFQDQVGDVARGVLEELMLPGGALSQARDQIFGGVVQSGFGTRSGGTEAGLMNVQQRAQDQVSAQVAQGAMDAADLAVRDRHGDLQALVGATQAGASRDVGLAQAQVAQQGHQVSQRLGALGAIGSAMQAGASRDVGMANVDLGVRGQQLQRHLGHLGALGDLMGLTGGMAMGQQELSRGIMGDIFTGAASIEQLGLAREQMDMNRRMLELAAQQISQQGGCGVGDALLTAGSGAAVGGSIGSLPGALIGGGIGLLGGLFGGGC